MSEITIDEQIKLLEEQLAGLKKQKKIFGEKCCIDKLNEKIIEAKKCGFKVQAIYVSTEIYHVCENFFQSISRCMMPVYLYYPSLKYQGYTIYANIDLKPDEIHIAI